MAATSTGTTPNPVNFSETNTAATTNDNMTITAGNNQSATVGAALPDRPRRQHRRHLRQPGPGHGRDLHRTGLGRLGHLRHLLGRQQRLVHHLLGGRPTPPATPAASTFTTNHTAGAIAVATSASGDTTPPTFAETSTAGTATTIAAYSGASQSATVSTSFTNPLLALVTDTFGNPVSGATVTFTAPAATGASGTFLATTNGGTCLATGGTAVASCTGTTSATGLASSLTFKADTHAGTYNVAATSAGTTPNPVNFSETNTVPLTVTSVASGTGTTSATSAVFSMTSGTTYVVTAFEKANATPTTPTLTITWNPTTTLITTNNFGGTTSANCRPLGATCTHGRSTQTRPRPAQRSRLHRPVRLELRRRRAGARRKQHERTHRSVDRKRIRSQHQRVQPKGNHGIGQPDERHRDWGRVRGDHRQRRHNRRRADLECRQHQPVQLERRQCLARYVSDVAGRADRHGEQSLASALRRTGRPSHWRSPMRDRTSIEVHFRARSTRTSGPGASALWPRSGARGRQPWTRRQNDESGAVLVLALVFLVAVSLIVTGLLTFVGTSLTASGTYSNDRNLEYAATDAVNLAIQNTRYSFDPYSLLDAASPQSLALSPAYPVTSRCSSTSSSPCTAPWCGSPTTRTGTHGPSPIRPA